MSKNHDQAVLVELLQNITNSRSERALSRAEILSLYLEIRGESVRLAESMAADLYGADQTLFLTNGSTQGIHGLIMAVCQPGDKILLPRNAHRSVLGGLILSGAEAVYVQPAYDEEWGLPQPLMPADVERALNEHPDCKAVMVVNPTYQGMVADMGSLASICHAKDIPLLVDEAHGAHLGFVSGLPRSSLQCGADGVVQSTHKLIGALTQSSMVHRQGHLLHQDSFDRAFSLLRPTQASLILLASLDGARRQIAGHGNEVLQSTVQASEFARREINRISGIRCFTREDMVQKNIHDYDPTKLWVQVSGLGMDGPAADRFLRQEGNIQCEFADLNNLLFMITIGDSSEGVEALIQGLKKLSRYHQHSFVMSNHNAPFPGSGEQILLAREAFFAQRERIPLAEAAGKVSQTVLCPYPPGIPVVYPGEKISIEMIDYLVRAWETGILVLGVQVQGEQPQVDVVRRA